MLCNLIWLQTQNSVTKEVLKVHFQNKKKTACAVIALLIALTVYIRFYMAAFPSVALVCSCLLYTSDAADDVLRV